MHKTCLACMHAKESGNMLISNNSYHDEKVTEYMNRTYELNTCMKAEKEDEAALCNCTVLSSIPS